MPSLLAAASFSPSNRSQTPRSQPATIKSLEITAYLELVRDDGRPLFPLALLDEVIEYPGDHHTMLRPWSIDPDLASPNDWRVFSRQRKRWQEFRKWQCDSRSFCNDEAYSASNKIDKRRTESKNDATVIIQPRSEETIKGTWEDEKRSRQCQRRNAMNPLVDASPAGYVDVARRRLMKHGFTQSFQFEENPEIQNRWTTWVEYIAFEAWWLDGYIASVERLRPHRDKAWNALVASGVLGVSETAETLCSIEARREREIEEYQVENAALAARETQDETQRATSPSQHRSISAQKSFQNGRRDALELLESRKDRNGRIQYFIRRTEACREATRDVRRHSQILSWAVAQLPLIEEEETRRRATEDTLVTSGATTRKRSSVEGETRTESNSAETCQHPGPERDNPTAISTGSIDEKQPNKVLEQSIRGRKKPTSETTRRIRGSAGIRTGGAIAENTRDDWLRRLRPRLKEEKMKHPMVSSRRSILPAGSKKIKKK